MAPNENQDQKPFEGEPNPFIAFRQFADDQVAGFVTGIMDFPEVLLSMKREFDSMETEFWKKFNEGYERSMNPERRQIEPTSRQPSNSASTAAPESSALMKQGCSWRDVWTQGGQTRPKDISNQDVDHIEAKIRDHTSTSALSHWLISSPYSPFQLEKDQKLDQQDTKWKEAFFDLLLAQRGESSAVKSKTEQHTALPTSKPPCRREEAAMPQTELDMYEHFLSGQAPSASSYQSPKERKQSQLVKDKRQNDQTDVVSTVKTIQEQLLPNGKIETEETETVTFRNGATSTSRRSSISNSSSITKAVGKTSDVLARRGVGMQKLPNGIEKRSTPLGQTYYIDHNNKTTSWNIPKASERQAAQPQKGSKSAGLSSWFWAS